MSHIVTPFLEMSQAIMEAGGEALKKCYQCGTCAGTCPWRPLTEFNIRKFVRMAQLGFEEIGDYMWGCSTCKFCVDRCPRGVELIDIVKAVRGVYSEGGMLPSSLRALVGSLSARGNPWSGDIEKRNEWTQGKYPLYESGMDYLYFTCCTVSYDQRNAQVAKATAELLNRAGVSWGIPGTNVNCCGESIGKVGDQNLFERLKEKNRSVFRDLKVKKVIVISPHCYSTFVKEYGDDYEVVHFTEILSGLIKEGKLTPKRDMGGTKVTYHDPCYLGRHSGIYDAPRDILKVIPGLEFVEMDRTREQSMCCGGGGGGLWIERAKGERLSDLRVAEAMEKEASILSTACPYCIAMLEDSIRTMNADERIKVKDISELVFDSLE
jgi:Fe-S oxidoreductase